MIGFRTLNDNPLPPPYKGDGIRQKEEIEQIERALAALTTTEEKP